MSERNYRLCWPYLILNDNKPTTIQEFGYAGDVKKCLNGYREIIVEDYNGEELIKIKSVSVYSVFSATYLSDVYKFIKNYEKYIAKV